MRISTEQLNTYVKCPILFKEGLKAQQFDKKIIDSLRKAIQYLYSHHMAHGEMCNFNALLKRWNQLWWGKYKPDDEQANKLSNKAYIAMDKYYNIYLDREYDGAYTNWPYAVEIGPHIVTGVWPVVLTKNNHVELYYPMSQKNTMDLIRSVTVKADIVAMTALTGVPPSKVSHSRHTSNDENPIRLESFFPKKEWLEKSTESLIMLISSVRDGYVWGNCHQCKLCELKNKCTG